jgi:signal recognition particle GTPase
MTSASLPGSETTFNLPNNAAPSAARLLQLVPTALTVLLLVGLAAFFVLPDSAGRSGNQATVQSNIPQLARPETPDADTFTLYLVDSAETAAELQEALVWHALHIAPANRGYEVVVTAGAAAKDPATLVSEAWQRFQRSDVRFVVIDLRGR